MMEPMVIGIAGTYMSATHTIGQMTLPFSMIGSRS